MIALRLTPDQVREQLHFRLPHVAGLLDPAAKIESLDLDSLDVMELLMLVDEVCGVRLSRDDLRQSPTVGALAQLIAAKSTRVPASS